MSMEFKGAWVLAANQVGVVLARGITRPLLSSLFPVKCKRK